MKTWLVAGLMMLAVSSLQAQLAEPEPLVHASGEPRSFQVVRVPVPHELRSSRGAGFASYATRDFDIIGRGMGWIDPRSGNDALVTVAISPTAVAGTRVAGRVVFVTQEEDEATVGIEMTVSPVYHLEVRSQEHNALYVPGERIALPYAVYNRGNTTEAIRVRFELPPNWRSTTTDTLTVTVEPFGVYEGVHKVSVPRNSSTGSFFVKITATSAQTAAESLITLSLGNSYDQLRPLGAAVSASVGTVATQDGRAEAVPQVAISGPVANDIHIDGRVTFAPELSAPLIRGLAGVGTYVTDPHLIAWNPRWRASFGSTPLAMTDLTGVNAGGRGFAFEHRDSAHLVSVVGARSNPGFGADKHGELLGAHVERNLSFARLGATATHLRGTGVQAQELSAIAFQGRSYPLGTFTLSGETAFRSFADGSGMGWSARLRHERKAEYAEFHFTHAPGGASAFARAENEVFMAFATTPNNPFSLAGSFADARDDTRPNYEFHARSASLSPSWLVSDRLRIRSDARYTSFDVDAAPIGYGTSEMLITVGGAGVYKGFGFGMDVGAGRLTRNVNADDIDADDSGQRYTWRSSLSRATEVGVFQLETNYERNSAGTGYLPAQFTLNARADRVQIPSLSERLYLDGEIALQSWTGMPFTPMVRAGAQYMWRETTLAFGVERNPLLTGIGQKTPWVFAIKLEKSVGVPRLTFGRAHGSVYQDLNGNGRRDGGEPGVENVAVRRGGLRVVTGADGGYRFWEEGRGAVTIDPTTLPYGWIVSSNRDGDIGLTATTVLRVTLQLGAAERARGVDISRVGVVARDLYGREWRARRISDSQAVFEALPVGRYTIDADFTALPEPLRVEREIMIDVDEGTTSEIVLPLAGRPLRFNQK